MGRRCHCLHPASRSPLPLVSSRRVLGVPNVPSPPTLGTPGSPPRVSVAGWHQAGTAQVTLEVSGSATARPRVLGTLAHPRTGGGGLQETIPSCPTLPAQPNWPSPWRPHG